jgi:hypothetical protein
MTTSSITHESGWNVSFWFAICSPLIGALLGVLALAILQHEPARQSLSFW